MKLIKFICSVSICFYLSFLVISCTKSPFDSDEISSGNREISGKVVLSDGFDAEGVYIWLEGFGIGVRSDAKGEFRVTLPPPAAQGTPSGVTGSFSLYFYLANYGLKSTTVVTRNGEFIFAQGEINKKGELNQPKELQKFLDINTVVEPTSISTAYSGVINVDVHLVTPLNDSATVVFPTTFGRPLGTVILKNLNTEQLFLFQSSKGNPNQTAHIIGSVKQIIEKDFDIGGAGGVLPVGAYEVIPHILIRHEEIPNALLQSLGEKFIEPGTDYLNLPMRRQGGRLEVVAANSN